MSSKDNKQFLKVFFIWAIIPAATFWTFYALGTPPALQHILTSAYGVILAPLNLVFLKNANPVKTRTLTWVLLWIPIMIYSGVMIFLGITTLWGVFLTIFDQRHNLLYATFAIFTSMLISILTVIFCGKWRKNG